MIFERHGGADLARMKRGRGKKRHKKQCPEGRSCPYQNEHQHTSEFDHDLSPKKEPHQWGKGKTAGSGTANVVGRTGKLGGGGRSSGGGGRVIGGAAGSGGSVRSLDKESIRLARLSRLGLGHANGGGGGSTGRKQKPKNSGSGSSSNSSSSSSSSSSGGVGGGGDDGGGASGRKRARQAASSNRAPAAPVLVDLTDSPDRPSSSSSRASWSCSACTLENTPDATRCVVCDTPRPQ